MRISIIANGFQEDYTLNLINALAKDKYPIDFLGSNIYSVSKIDPGITFYKIRKEDPAEKNPFKKGFWVARYFYRYLLYLLKQKRNIIHIQWLRFDFIDGVLFPNISKLLGHKVVYTAHDVVPHDDDTSLNRFIFKLIYRSQNYIVVHTNYIRDRIINEFHINPGKIRVIKHGIYKLEKEPEVNPEKYKKMLGISEDEYVLLFFGIITGYKGLDLLADSLDMLKEETKMPVRLIVAGRVQKGFEEEMEYLKKERLTEGVDFYLRFIEEEEVNQLFGATDLTVLPYREASQSGVMFMSYTHGVPVVAPELGGFPDDIVEGENGFLFKTNDELSLKDMILKANSKWGVNNREIRRNIIQLTSGKYKWEKSAEELIEIYKDLSEKN